MKIGDDQLEQVDTMKCLGTISSDGGTYVCRGIEVRIGVPLRSWEWDHIEQKRAE